MIGLDWLLPWDGSHSAKDWSWAGSHAEMAENWKIRNQHANIFFCTFTFGCMLRVVIFNNLDQYFNILDQIFSFSNHFPPFHLTLGTKYFLSISFYIFSHFTSLFLGEILDYKVHNWVGMPSALSLHRLCFNQKDQQLRSVNSPLRLFCDATLSKDLLMILL